LQPRATTAADSRLTVRRRAFKLGQVSSSSTHRRLLPATPVVALACALGLGAAGCLTDTPPKTPNQRDAERNAPVVVVPPPPDAGRTPRPAP
jgi:hypothetical protein